MFTFIWSCPISFSMEHNSLDPGIQLYLFDHLFCNQNETRECNKFPLRVIDLFLKQMSTTVFQCLSSLNAS